MNPHRLMVLILLVLLLSACGRTDKTLPITEPAVSQVPLDSPTAEMSDSDDESSNTEDDMNTPESPPAADFGEESTTAEAEISTLSQPSLFDNPWDDHELFRSSLVESERAIVDELTGAPIYHMKLVIDEPTAVSGQMEVHYTNQEEVPLQEIFLHLFPGQLGGSITISGVTLNGQELEPEITETYLRVPLDSELNPGESAVLQMEFLTTVPPKEESTKYNILAFNDGILALAHFYPMIAVFDEGGWHIEPSPPHGDETYADMSHYLVELTAPSEQIIAASGIEIESSKTDETQTIIYAIGPARDFYLAMSDRYGVVSSQVGDVQINSYAPKELLDGAEYALDVAVHAVNSFSDRYAPYPYTELDIVSTPTQALGIEYPGIFANAVRVYDLSEASSSGIPNAVLLESVTAHETGHQWFYNLVGSDQLNEPWLDEATTQYATWMYYVDRYGKENAQGYFESLRERWARTDFADIPIGMPAEDYSGQEYGAIVYGRGPIFLDDLAQAMGQDVFDDFMRDYTDTYSWQIATSEDFQALAETHCQCDLSSFFEEAVYAH